MIKYKYDFSKVDKALNELSLYKKQNSDLFFKQVSTFTDDLVMFSKGFLYLCFQPIPINSDNISASTSEITISYEPTSKFNKFLVALRAINW